MGKDIKKINMNGLSSAQKSTMNKHKKHHSLEHLKYMIGAMKNGKSFTEAHKIAMDKIGK